METVKRQVDEHKGLRTEERKTGGKSIRTEKKGRLNEMKQQIRRGNR